VLALLERATALPGERRLALVVVRGSIST